MNSMQKRHEDTVRFVGEQDGEPERRLKNALRPILTDAKTVQKAYLARVTYGRSDQTNVALCLLDSSPSRTTAERCGQTFHALFSPQTALDILFLTTVQDGEISKVCRPFFQR
jgi:hypothetical protein